MDFMPPVLFIIFKTQILVTQTYRKFYKLAQNFFAKDFSPTQFTKLVPWSKNSDGLVKIINRTWYKIDTWKVNSTA